MTTDARGGSHRLTSGLLFALTLCLALGLFLVMQAQAGSRDARPGPSAARAAQPNADAATGEVLVRLKAGASLSSRRALARSLGAATFRDLRVRAILPPGQRILLYTSTALNGEALVRRALRDPSVIAAALNDRLYAAAVTPNDPLFLHLWGLDNTGQAGGAVGADISAPAAWSTTTGSSGVVVADIDTGVAYDHPDLAANMWHNTGEIPANGIDDDLNGYVDDVYGINAITGSGDPYDDNGHGTHTSGTMAAVGNNGIGVSGVAWQARIMALKFLPAAGSGLTADGIECIDYVVEQKVDHGVNVVAINASWGGGSYNSLLRSAINAAGAAGIVFCAAAGNGGDDSIGDNNDTTPFYPSSYDCANIIAVASTDDHDVIASSSNYGSTSVDLAAPGVGILSTVPAVGVSLEGVAFTDATNGWAVGNGGILATTNGGATWGTRSSGSWASLYGIAFSDATRGWAVGEGGAIRATVDGGATWSAQRSGSDASLYGVAFSDASRGWAVGDGGAILATTNGGATWSTQNSGSSAWLFGVAFADATHGWAVGDGGTILATTNGGATWSTQNSASTARLYDVTFVDATRGWAVGRNGALLMTTSGGATWSAQNSGTTEWLEGVTFRNDSDGWVVGRGGTILATTNGGATWSAQNSGSSARLWAVTFVSATQGWAVGEGGTILVTTNGGATWGVQTLGTGGWYANMSGTSMATPQVTGAVALCAVEYPLETVAQRVQRILDHVDPLAALSGKTVSGGRLELAAAVTPVPTLASFTPLSGPVGSVVTLSGTGFSGISAVGFSGVAATFSVVSATQIAATVPAGATSGAITVTSPGGSASSVGSFTVVPAPSLVKLKPTSGKRGATVTMTGASFGATRGTSSVRFGSKACTKYVTWSDGQITCQVPSAAVLGKVKVTVTTAAGASNAMSFTVRR
jgi:photosystem II stability/assembly factor-like uncharacterized protein